MNAQGSSVSNFIRRGWRLLRLPLAVLVVAYVGLVIYRIPAVGEQKRSEQAIDFIKSQKLTLADVDGNHLPPPPDSAQVDATVAGVDVNQNGIRDDVELAIFKKYPNSSVIRAAELQYAMGLQMYLTKVFDSETWKAAAAESDRGYQCIASTYSRTDLNLFNKVTDARIKEVEDIEFNTEKRKVAQEKVASFATSFALPDNNFCDISLSSF